MAPYAAGCSLPLLLIKLDDPRFCDSPSPKCGWLITFNAGLPTGDKLPGVMLKNPQAPNLV